MVHQPLDPIVQGTRSAFIWTRILGVPFWGLVNMLSIILYKDMHITPLQITAIIALKPMSALLAPYWSQAIYQRPDRVVGNLVWSNILRYLPFMFLPWIDSPWLIISIFGLYMMLYRGAIPAWMETFKQNLPEQTRERVVSYGTTIDYCGAAVLPLVLGILLDGYEYVWRWLFPLTAFFGLVSTWFLFRISSPSKSPDIFLENRTAPTPLRKVFKEQILKPWKHSWQLMRENRGFASFQIGFMLGGSGLMILQPALPIFFVDVLNLSYTKMLLALAVCKGIGFALAAPFWTKLFRKINIYYFSGLVTILAALFPFFLLGAQSEILLLYFAYGLYGIMQAGSDLSWHLSGPVFAKEKDSSVFSGTNVITVGMRGCIIPSLGAFLYSITNSTIVMLLAALLSVFATGHLFRYSYFLKQEKGKEVEG